MCRGLLLLLLVVAVADPWDAYASGVASGQVVACSFVRQAVDRWYQDLDRQETDKFPYRFDAKAAKAYIGLVQLLQHSQGFTGSIELEPWQQFIFANLFGWKHTDGTRRFTKAYVEVARKNGKTVMGSGAMTAMWWLDGEFGAELFFLARDRSQAKKGYDEFVRQHHSAPSLRDRVREYRSSNRLVKRNDAAAFATPVSRDSKNQDSWNPHAILVDEYHAHPDNSLINVYESGMGSRRQPMTLIITTAGTDLSGPAYQEERTLVTQILSGELNPRPEHIFGIVYTLDDGDDYRDPAVWEKSNPNLGVSFRREYLEKRLSESAASPRKLSDVLTKNFNVWLNASTRWMDAEVWRRCGHPVDESSLVGAGAHGGLDLSLTTDITAVCWAFPAQGDGRMPLVWRMFIPEEGLRDRIDRDRVPYDAWARDGWILPTPGETVDYEYVLQVLQEDAERFGAISLGYDPWRAGELTRKMEGMIELVKYQQRFSGMAAPSMQFEGLVKEGRIAHGNNPVAAWMMANVEIKEDRQGNIMPMKPKRDAHGKRIDGIVAAIMAVDRCVGGSAEPSVYDERGVLAL